MSNHTQNIITVLNISQITFKMPVQELCWEKYDFLNKDQVLQCPILKWMINFWF